MYFLSISFVCSSDGDLGHHCVPANESRTLGVTKGRPVVNRSHALLFVGEQGLDN
jgi:hypothetical protein